MNQEDKRADEMTNDAFTGESNNDSDDDSKYYEQFLHKPEEGGQSGVKFNYKQFITESDDTSDTADDISDSADDDSKSADDKYRKYKDNSFSSESSENSDSYDNAKAVCCI